MFQSFEPSDNCLYERELLRKREKTSLRRNMSFVGALSLALTLVMQFAFTVVVVFLLRTGVLSSEGLTDPFLGMGNTAYLFMYSLIYVGALLIPALVVALCYKKRENPFSPAESVPFGFVLLMIIGAVGLCMLTNIINSIILTIFQELGLNVPDAPQMMDGTFVSFLLNLFVIAVLPALLEEMIYRGYILRVLRPYGNLYAVMISSMLFSLMHGNLRQIPFAFLVGLVLGYAYIATNNIWIPIAIHFANNAISVTMEYFAFSLPVDYQGAYYGMVIYGLAAIGVLATIMLIACYHRRMRIAKTNDILMTKDRYAAMFTTPLFVAATALYAVLLFVEI